MDSFKVGGDCEAYCTTCKTMKDHVIVAMVGTRPAKVECAGCHKQHAYRAAPPGTPKPPRSTEPRTRKAAATAEPPPPAVDLDARIAGREAVAYSPDTRYAVDDVVRHPTFGVGVVTALPAAQKVEITFRAGRKLLLHDRGGAQASTLQRPPPRRDDERTPITDAPPPSTK